MLIAAWSMQVSERTHHHMLRFMVIRLPLRPDQDLKGTAQALSFPISVLSLPSPKFFSLIFHVLIFTILVFTILILHDFNPLIQ